MVLTFKSLGRMHKGELVKVIFGEDTKIGYLYKLNGKFKAYKPEGTVISSKFTTKEKAIELIKENHFESKS